MGRDKKSGNNAEGGEKRRERNEAAPGGRRSALYPQSNLRQTLDRHVVAIWPGSPC